MNRITKILPLILTTSALHATFYTFLNDDRPIHFDADARAVEKANFKTDAFGSVRYRDGSANLYLSYVIDPKNTLTLGLGASYLDFDWDKNPRFKEETYTLARASLAYITTSLDKWRWVAAVGGTANTKDFNPSDTGVLYGYLWGRYVLTPNIGGHIGAIGWGGMGNSKLLPIVGIDWKIARPLFLQAIFPFNLDLRFYFSENWYTAVKYNTFGPYRYPWRARGGIGPFERAIFDIYSRGLELNLNYFIGIDLEAGIGGGYNFGGWIRVKDRHNAHSKYFKFQGAPFAHAYLNFNF